MPSGDREVHIVDMKMYDIKAVGILKDHLQHEHMMGELIHAVLIETKRASAGGDKLGLCDRIAACIKGHIVSLSHQFLCEIRNHTFRTPIVLRRYAFIKRCNLSDSQGIPPP